MRNNFLTLQIQSNQNSFVKLRKLLNRKICYKVHNELKNRTMFNNQNNCHKTEQSVTNKIIVTRSPFCADILLPDLSSTARSAGRGPPFRRSPTSP